MMPYLLAGALFWGCGAGVLYSLRPRSRVHAATMESLDRRKLTITLAVMLAVILLCTLPMSLSPYWNGQIPEHRDQYEMITEAFLNGHLYFDEAVDPALLAMENPYDTVARFQQGVPYEWDHALYGGHYYMYFGVVPVFVLFLPFRLLTGMSLTSFHATQIFVALFICGLFALFYLLGRRFFPSMTFAACLALSAAFSMMSVWYCAMTPALYCTAISAALCMEVWSLYCFLRAVFVEADTHRSLRWAFFGSLFGALAFGCRPPVAIANLLVLPLLAEYLRTPPRKRIRDLALAAAPYFVIGALLMLYNYLRFDSPFEFGQTYQLTGADQSMYGVSGNGMSRTDLLNAVLVQLFQPPQLSGAFPRVTYQSLFGNFPILLFSLWALLDRDLRAILKELHLLAFSLVSLVCCLVILTSELTYSPIFLERYRSDLYWLMALVTFIAFGCQFRKRAQGNTPADPARGRLSCLTCAGCLLTAVTACLFFLVPCDHNFAELFPQAVHAIERVLRLGF